MKPVALGLKIMHQAIPFLAPFQPQVKVRKSKCKKTMNF